MVEDQVRSYPWGISLATAAVMFGIDKHVLYAALKKGRVRGVRMEWAVEPQLGGGSLLTGPFLYPDDRG